MLNYLTIYLTINLCSLLFFEIKIKEQFMNTLARLIGQTDMQFLERSRMLIFFLYIWLFFVAPFILIAEIYYKIKWLIYYWTNK